MYRSPFKAGSKETCSFKKKEAGRQVIIQVLTVFLPIRRLYRLQTEQCREMSITQATAI